MSFITAYEPHAPALIERGPFFPASGPNKPADDYQAMEYGWMVGLSLGVRAGDYDWYHNGGKDFANRLPPPPSTFDLKNVDVEGVYNAGELRGVQYYIWTCETEWEWSMWESHVNPNLAPQLIPTRPNGVLFQTPAYGTGYGVKPNADRNICSKIAAGAKRRGVPWGSYWNCVNSLIMCDGYTHLEKPTHGYAAGAAGVPPDVQQAAVNFKARRMQEFMLRFKPPIMWLDFGGPLPENRIPEWARLIYYNACKSINPDVIIVGNMMADETLGPADVVGLEEAFPLYLGQPEYQGQYASFQGLQYYKGNELCGSPINYFYWLGPNCLIPEPNFESKYSFQDPAKIQEAIDICHRHKMPYLVNILIKDDGKLYQKDLDFLDDFDIHRTPFVPPSPAQPPAPTGLAANGRQVSFQQAPGTVATDYEYEFIEQA